MEELSLTRRSFLKAAAVTGAAAAVFSPTIGPMKGLAKAKAAGQSPATKVVRSCCRACIHNCGVLVHVQDGRVVKIEGDPEYPMTRGALCAKGLSGIQALYHPNRNKYPLKRVGARGEGKWQRISWDEAIDTIAQKLMEMREKYGAESVFASTGGGGNPAFASIRRFCNAFGTPNWVEPGCAQCYLPRTFSTSLVYGGATTSIADSSALELYFPETLKTKCLVLWGTVPAYDAPAGAGRCLAEIRAKGIKTVVIDPRLTPDAAKADIWLPIRPGTDTALLLSWIKYIIDEGLDDREFVKQWTNGPFLVNPATKLFLHESDIKAGGDENVFVVWDEKTGSAKAWPFPGDPDVEPALFGSYTVNGIECKPAYQLLKERADEWPIEKAAEVCWLDPNKVREAVQMYAANKPSGLILGVATDQHVNSFQSAHASLILDGMLGNVEKPGALLQRFKSAPSTNMLTGLNALLPNEQLLKRLGLVEHKGLLSWWTSHIPTLLNAIMTGQPYKPRVWIERSGNKLAQLGNASSWYEAIKQLDFIVHMYMYPTSFSAMADIVLPATEWLETNLPVTSCNMIFARQEVVHLWETMDETLFWAKLVKRCAELGHEGCQKAFDPNVVKAPEQYYWSSMEEYLDRSVASLNMTWKEFCEKAPITFAPLDEWRQYYVYKQVDQKTGLPMGFRTPSKKFELYLEQILLIGRNGGSLSPIPLDPAPQDYDPLPYYMEPPESPLSTPDLAKEFPYTLTSGRLPYYHHGTLRNIPWLRELYPAPQIHVNPVDAADLGIKEGDWVWVESKRGKTRAVTHVTEGIPPKVVYMERFWYPELPEADPSLYGWRESNVNILTKNDPPYNPELGTYILRGFLVKIYKADGAPEGVWLKPEQFKPWLPSPEGGA